MANNILSKRILKIADEIFEEDVTSPSKDELEAAMVGAYKKLHRKFWDSVEGEWGGEPVDWKCKVTWTGGYGDGLEDRPSALRFSQDGGTGPRFTYAIMSDGNEVSLEEMGETPEYYPFLLDFESGDFELEPYDGIYKEASGSRTASVSRVFKAADDSEKDDKREALAQFLNVDVDKIEDGYDDDHFEDEHGEYAVFTDSEADEEFARQIESLIDDLGISAFAKSFQEEIKSNYLKQDWFREALEEGYRLYCEDLASEDGDEFENGLVKMCYENDLINDNDFEEDENGDPDFNKCKKDFDELAELYSENMLDGQDCVELFRMDFGDEELNEAINSNGLLDVPAVIEAVKEIDGRGHEIASYDGVENEQGDYFIYRTN